MSATRSAVLCMREEELPRRIAFVSDKVFEPRWWQKFFASGPQLGFASAAMLAVAIVFHAMHASGPGPRAPRTVAQVESKVDEAEIAQAECRQRSRKVVSKTRVASTDRVVGDRQLSAVGEANADT